MRSNSFLRRLAILLLVSVVFPCFGGDANIDPLTIESAAVRFTLWPDSGAYEIRDRRSGVLWGSNPWKRRFGQASLAIDGATRTVDLGSCAASRQGRGIDLIFHPVPDRSGIELRVGVAIRSDGRTLDFTAEPSAGADWQNIRLLDDALWVNDSENGGVLVPVREGILIPSNSGLNFQHRFGTYEYEGCHMQMAGLLKRGSAALLTWTDPYVTFEVRSRTPSDSASLGRQAVSCSLDLRRSARSFSLELLGEGDQNTVAAAYRKIAKERGWFVDWRAKLKRHPERARLFGAINYKLWSVLDRRMDEASAKEESARVNWTFEEAARVAEHLKNDLKLERVLFILGGWIHRGYDNQHPDILPAAPECGGNLAFAEASRRIRACGYVLGLHDNYQDIYRDAPSWSEDFIMRRADGNLAAGGHWAGGRAYLTCSPKALELARRPQNLPAVRELTRADAYFIDTTYASGLQECFDPKHPLTRADDMRWKQALSDYARDEFGIFGSECGREWALPHADFFEGLTGVSGRRFHDAGLEAKLGAAPVPLFEMVYRDTIAMYGRYGYGIEDAAEYVLSHISLGRPMHHHDIPPHLYWTQSSLDTGRLKLSLEGAEVKPLGPRAFTIACRWNVSEAPTNDWQVFIHFRDVLETIKFQADHLPVRPIKEWPKGKFQEPPHGVIVPAGIEGTFEVRAGLFALPALNRALLQGRHDGERSYLLGHLSVKGDTVTFTPVPDEPQSNPGDRSLFVRGDNGWTEGMHPVDRFVKNTYEVLSPLNELTSMSRMTRHEFLDSERRVVRTVFGEGPAAMEVVINLGAEEVTRRSKFGGDVILPRYGFLVEGRTFAAFHALGWAGRRYDAPVLFTLRSQDKNALDRSRKLRVYHAFGDASILIGNALRQVKTEAVLDSQEDWNRARVPIFQGK